MNATRFDTQDAAAILERTPAILDAWLAGRPASQASTAMGRRCGSSTTWRAGATNPRSTPRPMSFDRPEIGLCGVWVSIREASVVLG